MSITIGMLCHFVAILLLLGSLIKVYSLDQCENDLCKTGLCNITGACICKFPDPSTILDGDRIFLGGKFCDEEMTMCDGTNSFWCEHGATCEENVQGEKYSCKCAPGFAGENCEQAGVPCGQIFCFHHAQCLDEEASYVCQCPSDWKGSADCSLLTTSTEFHANSTTATEFPRASSNSDTNKTLAVLAFSSVGAVAAGAIYGKKLCSKKKRDAFKFQELSQMQTQGVLLDDDDEGDNENHSMVSERVRADISHI